MSYKNLIIIDNQYFPLTNLLKYSFKKTHIILFSCEIFSKTTFRNRCVLAGSNGLINLSIPVKKNADKNPLYRDIRICNYEKWQINHWRTIFSCYNRSPYFEYYRDDLECLFKDQIDFLFDFNISIMFWLKRVLNLKAEIIITEQISLELKKDASIKDLRNRWIPKNFQDESFDLVYPQVFEDRIGFQSNLSILDLLFNTGPECMKFLEKTIGPGPQLLR